MQIIKVSEDRFEVSMSSNEFWIVAHCLTETLEAVDRFEFHARLGVEEEVVRALRDQMADAGRTLK